ncbi:MAG: hypothetical protein AAGI49_07150, partial [Bacteroidota bacterium]
KEETEMTGQAKVLSLTVSGSENNYRFNVEVESPDTGCDQYADWWEVFSESGELVYRRILTHSHVNEQPFKRSGGTINITDDQVVFVRAHMNNLGYGMDVMKGSVNEGFLRTRLDTSFAADLANQEPLPRDCAF